MQKCLSFLESKEVDKFTISKSISSLDLMEKAANKIYEYLSNKFDKSYYFLILTGKGNNAGDGYALARLLLKNSYVVDVLALEDPTSQEAIINKNKYNKETIKNINIKEKLVVIDAIFGVGFKGELPLMYQDLLSKINEIKGEKIAIDLASGLDNEGFASKNTFKADITLAIGSFKLAYFLNNGKDYSGKVELLDINLDYLDKNYIEILENDDFKNLFLKRKENVNKGSFGKVSLIGGSFNTPGALNIAKKAYLALHFGSGYAECVFPKSVKEIYEFGNDEVIYKMLSSKKDGTIKFKKKEIKGLLSSKSISLGMGSGVSKDIYKIISYLLKHYEGNLILDADALNTLSKYGLDILKNHKCEVILTPHLKEFSRLTNLDLDLIKRDRIRICEEFVNKYNIILLLKDNTSYIVSKRKKYLNINGNASLAKGGSGDALSGILGGILYSKENIEERVAFSSYLLGESSDIRLISNNEYTTTIQDIIDTLNHFIKKWRNDYES